MKVINLAEQAIDIAEVLMLAQSEPVVLVAADGREYMVAEADDFDQEVEQLRQSVAFQAFLDERSARNSTRPRRSLDEVAQAIEAEIASNRTKN